MYTLRQMVYACAGAGGWVGLECAEELGGGQRPEGSALGGGLCARLDEESVYSTVVIESTQVPQSNRLCGSPLLSWMGALRRLVEEEGEDEGDEAGGEAPHALDGRELRQHPGEDAVAADEAHQKGLWRKGGRVGW